METSLSVVIPVRNAQAWLAQEIADLLELLGEICARFEVILVDDASQDRTEEIAYELAHQFPQVRCTAHRRQLGIEAAARTGLSLAGGEIVFLQEESQPIHHGELLRLWEHRGDPHLAIARLEPDSQPLDGELLQRWAGWSKQLQRQAAQHAGCGGLQMIRVEAIRRLDSDAAGAVYRLEAGGPAGLTRPRPVALAEDAAR